MVYLLESVGSTYRATNDDGDFDVDDSFSDDGSLHSFDIDIHDSDGDMDDFSEKPVLYFNDGQLDVESVKAEMARIDMDDDEDILARIKEVFTFGEQSIFSFNTGDEAALGLSQSHKNL